MEQKGRRKKSAVHLEEVKEVAYNCFSELLILRQLWNSKFLVIMWVSFGLAVLCTPYVVLKWKSSATCLYILGPLLRSRVRRQSWFAIRKSSIILKNNKLKNYKKIPRNHKSWEIKNQSKTNTKIKMSQRGKRGSSNNRPENDGHQPPTKRRKGRPPNSSYKEKDREREKSSEDAGSSTVPAGTSGAAVSSSSAMVPMPSTSKMSASATITKGGSKGQWQMKCHIADLKLSSIYNQRSSEAPAELFR